MIGPCKTNCDLRRKERFNKSPRVIVHSNCLLPVLSGGELKFLVTSFECFAALLRRCMLSTLRERFHRRRPTFARAPRVERSQRAGREARGCSASTLLDFAVENRLRAAAGGDMWKGTLLISRLDFAVNSISIPVIR